MRYLFFLLLISSCSLEQEINRADLILSSDKVILMIGDQKAQPLSIAIKNEKIIWVGSHKNAKNIQGKHIDFGDQAILPGFIDAHGHASYLAFATQVANLASPPVGGINTIKELQAELRKFIEEAVKSVTNLVSTAQVVLPQKSNWQKLDEIDYNEDGKIDALLFDSNMDGAVDLIETDADFDGVTDYFEFDLFGLV